jgi:hypothetical protein
MDTAFAQRTQDIDDLKKEIFAALTHITPEKEMASSCELCRVHNGGHAEGQ